MPSITGTSFNIVLCRHDDNDGDDDDDDVVTNEEEEEKIKTIRKKIQNQKHNKCEIKQNDKKSNGVISNHTS